MKRWLRLNPRKRRGVVVRQGQVYTAVDRDCQERHEAGAADAAWLAPVAEQLVIQSRWALARGPSVNLESQESAVKLKSLLVVALVVGVVGAAPLARAADPNVGNWKFNAEKSKGTMFKSGTSNIEADGDGIKVTVDLAGTDGTPYHWTFSAKDRRERQPGHGE